MRAHPGRKGHPPELRQRAAELRRAGRSRADIARELDVAFGTVSRWFREDRVPAVPIVRPQGWVRPELAAVRERWQRQDEEQRAHSATVGQLTDRELLILGAGLYWAEGTKAKPWRRAHRIVFMNSDPTMITAFLAYLAALGVERGRLVCTLSIHETADIAAAEEYWRGVVGEELIWRRPALKRHNAKPVRYNRGPTYVGCLRIDVTGSGPEYRRIAGTWQGVATALGAAIPRGLSA